jgi:Cu2+-exporting ATPase
MVLELLTLGSLVWGGKKWSKHKKKSLQTSKNTDKTHSEIKYQSTPSLSTIRIKKETEHGLLMAVGAGGFAIMSRSYPPLVWASLILLFFENVPIFKDAYHSLRKKSIDNHTLVSIIVIVCLMKGYLLITAISGMFYHISRYLLHKVKDDSRQQFIDVFNQHPKYVWLWANSVEIKTPFETLKVGDIIVVHAGETIPIDGSVVEGISLVDQQLLTGESQPLEKCPGDKVFALTLALSGRLLVSVEQSGQATVAANIGEVLNHTLTFKTDKQLWMEKVNQKMAIPALLAGGLSVPFVGVSGGAAVINSIPKYRSTIMASLNIMTFFTILLNRGILVKDGLVLEAMKDVDTLVFDKTGTLTMEQPQVGLVQAYGDYTKEQVLFYAAALEQCQTHPIAKAIITAVGKQPLPLVTNIEYRQGYGLSALLDSHSLLLGSLRLFEESGITLPDELRVREEVCYQHGHSLLLLAIDNCLIGHIELHISLRPGIKTMLKNLRQYGVKSVCIISGDHPAPTRYVAQKLGIEDYFAEVLPEQKSAIIEQLQSEGKTVCYIGDGINDAIALKKAQISISLRGASSVATDTARIVLLNSNLRQLETLFEIAHDFNRTMKTTFLTTLVPSVLSFGGVFLLGFGIPQSLVIGQIGLVMGLGNIMIPKLKYQQKNIKSLEHSL